MQYSIDDLLKSPFEKIKRISEDGYEYWSARDLSKLLEYTQWRNFENVISKAKISCKNNNEDINNHFADVSDMVKIGSGAEREVDDYRLSRFACYLIVQNADPSKINVALGQAYFAIKTRQKELIEEDQARLIQSEEDTKRLFLREQMKMHNKQLADAASNAGIEAGLEYAIFQDYGYQGLYGGLKAKDIHARKGLKKSQKILDHMGSTELAANLFRATQTEEKLRRENIKGKMKANQTHYEVGKKVRQTIEELGGTMPEDLPTVDSIKKLERQKKKELEDNK
ncbi:MAG: DNA damage-inducible protein D [Candidatus Gastranaerophilales bacterium]|nr:DNA damage-inducible protein D [Candidatus Gastranaerophilales bacterium]